jgi:hypothetical protein
LSANVGREYKDQMSTEHNTTTDPDTDPDGRDQIIARKGRHIATVIAGAMVVWFGAGLVGKALGLPGRYAILFDLVALAALIYAMVNIYKMWRMRQESQG